LSPIIAPLAGVLPSNYHYEDNGYGVKVVSNDSSGCITEMYGLATYGLQLNEAGQCKFAISPLTNFENMEQYLSGSNLFRINHTSVLTVPNLESFGISPFMYNATLNASIYVRCQDKAGNKNERDFAVSFCIKQGPDKTPPVIVDREPYLEQVKYDATHLNSTVFVNEPAECRWSIADKNYTEMEHELDCWNEIEDQTPQGFPCYADFAVTGNESNYNIRCLDQHWLVGENATKRNEGNTYQFRIKKVSEALKIDSITPDNNTLVFGTTPATIEVIARTSGGLDGSAKCSFKTAQGFMEFAQTLGSEHKQVFNQVTAGPLIYTIYCEDLIGNIAEKNASVIINLDEGVPKVSRVFSEGDKLNVITNERANCVFSIDTRKKCKFAFGNASAFEDFGVSHSTIFDKSKTYYVKCKDSFGNGLLSDSCAAVIEGEHY
jgi:hypothetical protein